MEISFFTTLELALAGAWIPSFAMVLIQFAYMFVYKEVGKRATDTSWYTLADKRNAIISSLLHYLSKRHLRRTLYRAKSVPNKRCEAE